MGPPLTEVGADPRTEMSRMPWGGRFERGPHPDLMALTASIGTDMRLLPQDLASTRAHARVLAAADLLARKEVARIDQVCEELMKEWEAGTLIADPGDEDVHSLVERLLTERLGETGRRIHAGRSRNDLVANDLRLWCRDAASDTIDDLRALISLIADFGDAQADTLMPGYTHLQPAQPISAGFHLVAHGFALLRDARRFKAAYEAADVSALGAGAIAGSTLGLDPEIAAHELDLSSTFDNAMDAVSDRDFAADLVYACALCGVHLSRLAEEIVLWTSSEFGFARLSDDWSTGSSMMPQKRNPDMAELIRGRASGGVAALTGLLALLKGLPLAYDRDLQEDKGYVFQAVDRLRGCIRGTIGLLGAIRFDKQRMAEAAAGSGAWATDLAEALVRRGVPFRDAHDATGKLVAALESQGLGLTDLDGEELRGFHDRFEPSDLAAADPRVGLAARGGKGGTAPVRVAEQAARLRSAGDALAS
jgi:argininosuccinate lyase